MEASVEPVLTIGINKVSHFQSLWKLSMRYVCIVLLLEIA